MSFAAYRDPPPRPDCPQCDDLRYEIEQLRIQLGQQPDLLTRHAIARAYRLTPKGADILTKLYGAYHDRSSDMTWSGRPSTRGPMRTGSRRITS